MLLFMHNEKTNHPKGACYFLLTQDGEVRAKDEIEDHIDSIESPCATFGDGSG